MYIIRNLICVIRSDIYVICYDIYLCFFHSDTYPKKRFFFHVMTKKFHLLAKSNKILM